MAVKTVKDENAFENHSEGLEELVALRHLSDTFGALAKVKEEQIRQRGVNLFFEQAQKAKKDFTEPTAITAGEGRARATYVLRRRGKNLPLTEEEKKDFKKNNISFTSPVETKEKMINAAHVGHAKLIELITVMQAQNPDMFPSDILVPKPTAGVVVTDENVRAVLMKKNGPKLFDMVASIVLNKPTIIGEDPTTHAWNVVAKSMAGGKEEAAPKASSPPAKEAVG